MGRPPCCKRISGRPVATLFGPMETLGGDGKVLTLALDEYEALKLAHLDGMYQEQAAERMGVSRATFGRILENAQRTVAKAIVEGWALRIEGEAVECMANQTFRCDSCHHEWNSASTQEQPALCPHCRREAPQSGPSSASEVFLCPKRAGRPCPHVRKSGCCPHKGRS